MTAFVVSIQGVFLCEVTERARISLMKQLHAAGPQRPLPGRSENPDVLTVREDGTFSIRLEVKAEDGHSAEQQARQAAAAALRGVGFSGDDAPLGSAAVSRTGT
jgi:hypothetical protein